MLQVTSTLPTIFPSDQGGVVRIVKFQVSSGSEQLFNRSKELPYSNPSPLPDVVLLGGQSIFDNDEEESDKTTVPSSTLRSI